MEPALCMVIFLQRRSIPEYSEEPTTTNVFEEITVKEVTRAPPNIDKYNPPQVVVGAKFKTGTQWAYTNNDGTKNPDPAIPLPLSIWPSGYSLVKPYPAKCSDFAVDTGTTMETAFGPLPARQVIPCGKFYAWMPPLKIPISLLQC